MHIRQAGQLSSSSVVCTCVARVMGDGKGEEKVTGEVKGDQDEEAEPERLQYKV